MKRQRNITFGIQIAVFVLSLLLPLDSKAIAQSVGEYEFTFGDMGYGDTTLLGHESGTQYYIGLPAYWEVLYGSYLDLNLEFTTPLAYMDGGVSIPTALLEVYLNGESIHRESLFSSGTYTLHVELPSHLFYAPEDEYQNHVEIRFVSYEPCEVNPPSSVMIHQDSRFHLAYIERPLPIELSRFPRPIYVYRALQPSAVRFVLPDAFEETDVRAAAIVAARLGQLTDNRLPISATLASEQLTRGIAREHLIIVGTPDKNPTIEQLELPISLTDRYLGLHSEMPTAVSPGSTMSYTLLVENTTPFTWFLVMEDRYPFDKTRFLGCEGLCEQVQPGMIRWNVGLLEAGRRMSTTVTLQVTPVVSLNTSIRHTSTLFDWQRNILNVDTLAARIAKAPDGRRIVSSPRKTTRFFAHVDQAVPENAGLIQAIVSPWSAHHMAVIVTGQDDEAVLMAAHGLNPKNRFPGISGDSAIVEDTIPITTAASVLPQDVSFASLEYDNKELNVINLEAGEYSFELPPGMTLGEDSHLTLHVAQAAIVSTVGGGAKITLNGVPIGSIYLDDSNFSSAWIQIPLPSAAANQGLNWVRIQATANRIDPCLIQAKNPYWFEIYADSYFHFDHRSIPISYSLGSFPYPFTRPGDMGSVTFALSDVPTLTEVEGLLRIASLLGSQSESKDFVSQVVFGAEPNLGFSAGSHVLAVGLPTTNPVIQDANPYLPQSFIPESDDIFQRIDSPTYGIQPGTDLGFVQELISPWDGEGKQALVVATGTTEKGLQLALFALSRRSHELRGDLTLVRGNEMYSTDTRIVASPEALSTAVPITSTAISTRTSGQVAVVTPTPQETSVQPSQTPELQSTTEKTVTIPAEGYVHPTSAEPTRPRWLIPLFIVSVLAVLVLFIAAMVGKAR